MSDQDDLTNLTPESQQEIQSFLIDPKQEPLRIDKFLMDRLKQVSRNKVQAAIKAGNVKVDGKTVKANYKIKPGEKIYVVIKKHPLAKGIVAPENISLDIRYEDEDLLIVHKPPGLVVHPGFGNFSGTLVNGLVYYLNGMDLPFQEGNLEDRPGLVHRIDKNTSGLLVIAKNEPTMTHLAKQFFDHTVKREYLALLWSEFDEDEGTITGNIGRDPRNRLKMTVFPDGDEGKHAVTHFEVVERLYYVSLVKCRLETGRTHQIRVHFSYKGHPVFNDDRYGGDRVVKGTVFSKYKSFVENCFKIIPRHALHAKTLGFIHPRTGKEMLFDSDLPEDFATVLEKWRKYVKSRKDLKQRGF